MITLPGRPITKKNHGQVIVRGGKRFHVQSNAFQRYETMCLCALYGVKEHYSSDVNLQAHYWLPNKSGIPDLVGLLQATCDILEKGGIVDNDRQIGSFDGSRIMGIDKANPRVEITITESRERTDQ